MGHWAFVDALWIGEGFSYDSLPVYWLAEISGLSFGVFSDMLGTPNQYVFAVAVVVLAQYVLAVAVILLAQYFLTVAVILLAHIFSVAVILLTSLLWP